MAAVSVINKTRLDTWPDEFVGGLATGRWCWAAGLLLAVLIMQVPQGRLLSNLMNLDQNQDSCVYISVWSWFGQRLVWSILLHWC